MGDNIDSIKEDIEKMKEVFNSYYEKFIEFYWAKDNINNNNNKYSLIHPQMIEESIKLQALFTRVPEILRERLLDLDLRVFLHCNNAVDFHSFREYLFDNQKHYAILTIASRIDAELDLAIKIIEVGSWENYDKLPRVSFNRKVKYNDLISEDTKVNEDVNTNEEELQSKVQKEYQVLDMTIMDDISSIKDKPAMNFINNYTEMLESTTTALENTNKFISTAKPIINFIKSLKSII